MLNVTKLSFPGLGIGEFSVNSEAFSLFGAPIAWYALIICFGMVFAVSYVIYRAKGIGIDSEVVLDFALFVIPIGVLGARLYYVLMDLDSFDSIWDALNIRNGGLAIYGGIIAGALTVFFVCKYKHTGSISIFGEQTVNPSECIHTIEHLQLAAYNTLQILF